MTSPSRSSRPSRRRAVLPLVLATLGLVGATTGPVAARFRVAASTVAPSARTPVTASGWGPVQIGMTYGRLSATLGAKATKPEGYEDFDGYCWYVRPLGDRGPSVMMNAPGENTAKAVALVERIESWTDDKIRLTTAKGVGPGSTRAAIMKAYPSAKASPHHYVDGGVYLDVVLAKNRLLRFELPNGKTADAMFVGTTGGAQYVEGCA